MITRVASTASLCLLLGACAAPSGLDNSPRPARSGNGGDTPVALPAAPLSRQQDGSYTPGALFMKAHGAFLLEQEYWQPQVEANLSLMSDAEVKSQAGDFNLAHIRARGSDRFYVDPDSFLKLGFEYGRRDYEFSAGATGAHDEVLENASLVLGYGTFIDEWTLLELDFKPGVWTDFSGTLHGDDWKFHGRALATIKFYDDMDLYYKVGVEVSDVYEDLDVYPLLGLSYAFDPMWRVDVLLPREARVSCELSPATALDIALEMDGGEYRIRAPRNAVNDHIGRDINVQELKLSFGARHRLSKLFSVHARVGTTLLGDYKWQSNATGIEYDGAIEPQIYGEIGFGLTF